jgi:hypothetical protein
MVVIPEATVAAISVGSCTDLCIHQRATYLPMRTIVLTVDAALKMPGDVIAHLSRK